MPVPHEDFNFEDNLSKFDKDKIKDVGLPAPFLAVSSMIHIHSSSPQSLGDSANFLVFRALPLPTIASLQDDIGSKIVHSCANVIGTSNLGEGHSRQTRKHVCETGG